MRLPKQQTVQPSSSRDSTVFRFPVPTTARDDNDQHLQRKSDPFHLKNVVFQHMENQLTIFDRIQHR